MPDRFDREGFAAALQQKANEYPLSEVALQTGVSASTLSRLERGLSHDPDLETFFAICSWLGMSPRMFMLSDVEDNAQCASCMKLRGRLAKIAELATEAG